ncbi:hypothetical protein SAMN06295912_11831 [Sphingomonas laterariae]|uniref:SecDF P1 head subdomain domain-containing protein n=1 Tax=Edaphosphingomonas laterariae TaxID=861865 RepID=A0A239HN26_9SPHN|nr:hypothetical protein [Sphingomonas laterariae]SNS82789.1 hypothetical protein SAMN06295912_11831 [Sphingomonas laterariae]
MKPIATALAALLLMAQAAGGFAIGGQAFQQAEILDARAMPELDGTASIMLTLDPAAAKRLEAITRAHLQKPVEVTLDGATIAAPVVAEPITEGVLTIAGTFTLAQAEAMAKRISGKDPLPEEFEE